MALYYRSLVILFKMISIKDLSPVIITKLATAAYMYINVCWKCMVAVNE